MEDIHNPDSELDDKIYEARKILKFMNSTLPNPYSNSKATLVKASKHLNHAHISLIIDKLLPPLKAGDWEKTYTTFVESISEPPDVANDFELRDTASKL